MPLDEALHDRQAEAGAAVLARARRVDLIERVEDARSLPRRDTDAGVRDANLDQSPYGREQREAGVVVAFAPVVG